MYLWLYKIPGTATSTHLGSGPYYVELCIYGLLTKPGADPPDNAIPMGWYADVQNWTAANGDVLRATGAMVGFTAPPPTPGFKFIESLTFLDGGTGRFGFAEGGGTGSWTPWRRWACNRRGVDFDRASRGQNALGREE